MGDATGAGDGGADVGQPSTTGVDVTTPAVASAPPTAGLAARRRWNPFRASTSALDAVAGREYLLVAFMVVVMTLSAFSVYQATRAGDAADDRLGTLRALEGDAARQSGYLQTVIAHDLSVLAQFCEAEIGRRDAMADLIAQTPDSAEIAAKTIMTRSIKPLLLGDRLAQCASSTESAAAKYDVARARQTLENSQSLRGDAELPPGQADAELSAHGTAEQNLMLAGLLFALALALLIAVDLLNSTDDRPRRLSAHQLIASRRLLAALAVVAAVVAAVLLAVFTIALPTDPISPYVTLGFAALVVAAIMFAARWRIPPAVRLEPAARPYWWAQVIGAGAIVIFSLAAVGLSSVSALEREANMRADALQASAQQLQQVGEQSALHDLAAVAISARFVAESAAAAALRLSEPERSATELSELAAIESRLTAQMNGFDASVRAQVETSTGPACLWARPPADAERSDPFTLYQELAGEQSNVNWHVRQYQEPALACDTAAEIARVEARVWARHGSGFTVALVVIGLAGFMLSLASDSRRDPRVSRILRTVGLLGVGVGIAVSALTLPDLLWRADLPEQDEVPDIAATIAAARVDPCREGTVAALDGAIEQIPGYGPAYDVRADAHLCAGAWGDWWRYSSDAEPEAVQAAIADYEAARDRGASSTGLSLNIGWVHLLDGIQRDDTAAVREGLRLTEKAIAEMEAAYPAAGDALAPGTTLHVARFNRALAYAALGEQDSAISGYREAIQCLAPAEACAGGGLLDDALVDETILWALADLELLGDPLPGGDEALDSYRLELVDDPSPRHSDAALEGASLDVYPQEAQVRSASPPARATVLWYMRWDDEDTWQLLQVPSRTTMHPGGYLVGRPIALGECAPEAYYRADVYTAGVRIPVRVEDDSAVAPPLDGIRVTSSRLALSAIVPIGWTTESDPARVAWCDVWEDHPTVSASATAQVRDDGLDWHVGPDPDSGLTVRRVEGVVPGDDIDAFLARTLDAWAAEVRGQDAAALRVLTDAYFLGSSYAIVADAGDQRMRLAVAYEPYAWEAPERGGTAFLGVLDDRGAQDDSNPVDLEWISEIVLETPQQPIPTMTVAGEGFTVEISQGWEVVYEPADDADYVLSAQTPGGDPQLYVYRSPADETGVGSAVDSWIEQLESGVGDWEDVVIESRREIVLPGAVAAEWIEYSRASGDSRRWAWEVFASDGETITNVYVTDLEANVWNVQSDIEAVLESLVVTP